MNTEVLSTDMLNDIPMWVKHVVQHNARICEMIIENGPVNQKTIFLVR